MSRDLVAGMAYIVLAAFLWAAVESIGPLLADHHHPLQVVWTRYAVHLALLAVVFTPRRGPVALVRTNRLRLQIARGVLMVLMPVCFLTAVAMSGPAEVLGVFWVTPLLMMVLATYLLRERVASWQWILGFGGWAGVLLILQPDAGALGLSLLPAFGMACSMSLYLVLTRMLRDEWTVTNLVYTAACVLLPLSLVLPVFASIPSLRTGALMTAIGVLGLGGLYAFDRALELAPVAAVSPMLYTQPLWVLSIAILVQGEQPGRAALAGMALVAAVVLLRLASTGLRLRQTQQHEFPATPEPAPAGRMETWL